MPPEGWPGTVGCTVGFSSKNRVAIVIIGSQVQLNFPRISMVDHGGSILINPLFLKVHHQLFMAKPISWFINMDQPVVLKFVKIILQGLNAWAKVVAVVGTSDFLAPRPPDPWIVVVADVCAK